MTGEKKEGILGGEGAAEFYFMPFDRKWANFSLPAGHGSEQSGAYTLVTKEGRLIAAGGARRASPFRVMGRPAYPIRSRYGEYFSPLWAHQTSYPGCLLYTAMPDEAGMSVETGEKSAESPKVLGVDLDLGLGEIELMDPTLVNIAAAVRHFDLTHSPFWDGLARKYESARLFAIECEPASLEIDDFKRFDGRARILLQIPQRLRSGREAIGSLVRAARVSGHIDRNNHIKIDNFHIPDEST
jgi:hypothetical protein